MAMPELPSVMMDMELILEIERRLRWTSESKFESMLSSVSELCVEGLISEGTLVSGGGDVDRGAPLRE